jgi:hypothetical protein
MYGAFGYLFCKENIMNAFRIVLVVLLFAAISVAVVMMQPASQKPELVPVMETVSIPAEPAPVPQPVGPAPIDRPEPTPAVPVPALEERGDAMLFEIDALQNTPFDQEIVRPFN